MGFSRSPSSDLSGGNLTFRALLVVVVLAVLAVGCSSANVEAPTPSGPGAESATGDLGGDAINRLPPVETWTRLIEILELPDLADERQELDRLVDPLVAEDLRLLVPDGGPILSQPKLTSSSVATAAVVDCAILPAPAFDGPQSSVAIEAELTLKEYGWAVTSLSQVALAGCVSEEMADDVLSGYWQFWNAVPGYWDPPDPASPAIGETTTGRHTDLTVQRLEQFVEEGKIFTLGVAAAPEIIAVHSATEVTILDCQTLDSAHGVFDTDSGQRLDDILPVNSGDREGVLATMQLDGDVWKVGWIETGGRNECVTAPSGQALAVVVY